jgi:hypothetical protein
MSHLASVLMLVALILRGALPQGWMPVGDGATTTGTSFVICSVSGPLQFTLDQDGKPVPDSPDDGTAHQPCAFASLASLSSPADGQAIPAPQFHGHASTPSDCRTRLTDIAGAERPQGSFTFDFTRT